LRSAWVSPVQPTAASSVPAARLHCWRAHSCLDSPSWQRYYRRWQPPGPPVRTGGGTSAFFSGGIRTKIGTGSYFVTFEYDRSSFSLLWAATKKITGRHVLLGYSRIFLFCANTSFKVKLCSLYYDGTHTDQISAMYVAVLYTSRAIHSNSQ
jgi:hypothetical protein